VPIIKNIGVLGRARRKCAFAHPTALHHHGCGRLNFAFLSNRFRNELYSAPGTGTRREPGTFSLSTLLYISPERLPGLPRHISAGAKNTRAGPKAGNNIVAGKDYLTRQATTLIKFARATTDPQVVAGLVDKAANLKSRVDEQTVDRSPRAPDVQPES
jgi:hypothetical protein